MKHMTCGIVFLLVAFATPVIYGGQPARGVAGVDVIVKQRPSDRKVTDARGNFALDALAAGSYTLTFRARKAEDLVGSTSDRVIVAELYAIKIEGNDLTRVRAATSPLAGTNRAVNINRLTSDQLLVGVDVNVDLGPGARPHGQVAANAMKNMVWIPKEHGSNLPGRWVVEGSAEHKAAVHHNTNAMSVEELQATQR
jgi:hypothetical protein